jgi:hypothetical protein
MGIESSRKWTIDQAFFADSRIPNILDVIHGYIGYGLVHRNIVTWPK